MIDMKLSIRKKIFSIFCLSFLLSCISGLASAQNKSPFPEGTLRILFLGNSITYDGRYVTDLETYFLLQYPGYRYEFINAGLPSETVSGLSEPNHADGRFPRPDLHTRLDRVLKQTCPDVVFACYGMNDGIYMPFDEERFEKYRSGIDRLCNAAEKSGVKKIYLLTPPIHVDGEKGTQGYNLVLDKYSEWLLSLKKSDKREIIDLHFPMKSYLEEKRKINPGFKLANDGIHPGETGHWLMAKQILLYLGEDVADDNDLQSALPAIAGKDEIVRLVTQRQAFMKDAWLTSTKHDRPEMSEGMSIPKARNLYDQVEERIRALLNGDAPKRTRIACVGNSITQGVGVRNHAAESYPARLQYKLGYKYYDVINYGVSGKTAMDTENAYIKTRQYPEALACEPDIVTMKLGTNDSRIPFREQIVDSFVVQYKRLVDSFKYLPSKPRIILLLPVASYLTDESKQTDKVIREEILPRIRQVAFEEKLEMIDLHSITSDRPDLFPDNLHPNDDGMQLITDRVYDAITCKAVSEFDAFKYIPGPYEVSSFYGYDCADFKFEDRSAKIVKPRVTAEGKPWVWRARFWGHEPQTDIALLDRGFHIVYCDPTELFGSDNAVKLWNNFYDLIQKMGLSEKAVLEGMSRGGVYAYNWAAVNPDKVVCVYADAPVLDLKSWPGGKGRGTGSPDDLEKLKKEYGLKSDKDFLKFKNSPIDKVPEIVKGGYPMLHVVGESDDVVPVNENTGIFERDVKALGGSITVIRKPGVGHHPHSLVNPQPIVDFIMKSISMK